MGTKVYFFSREWYLQYDRGEDRAEGFPRLVGSDWDTGFPGFTFGFDTAVNWGDGTLFFFKDDQYSRYRIAGGHLDDGYPLYIRDHRPGMKDAGFDADLDAAVNWGNGKVFFFKQDQYVRYDIKTDKVDDRKPLSIGDKWPGMKDVGFDADLDAAINWGNGKAYFFKGNLYVRSDVLEDKVDEGYPLVIGNGWPGMSEAGLAAGFTGVVDLLDLTKEIWLDGATIHSRSPGGPAYLSLPWRGILHTTEGTSLSGAESTLDAGRVWPHVTIDPFTLTVIQQLPLNRGARAVGDSVTPCNAANAVQIEIVGRAVDAPNWAPEQLAFIRDVMRQIEAVIPVPRTSDRTFLDQAGVSSTPSNRMSIAEWKKFSGWCGHQHVPGNLDRWDPGAIDIDTLLHT